MTCTPRYPDHLTPCHDWVSDWLDQFRDEPEHAWNTFESAHRTAYIILKATRPGDPDDFLIETLIQAQLLDE
ncbi:hypothetical protein C7446_2687 [Kushneria sinocarnis]|uniref:Uncharacterized protein n=1 Tax=Kushneria sinocarnis TaxID=595502 RepID=A0A420WV12_9GAMM|nr:hypothetical protein [Kushneria sinocarnis]RKQ97262.1 hypothetical protein C7446_2687 [Kushneria sinocarnis]